MLELLQIYLFTGITGNTAYDILKKFWQRAFGRSIEELYLDAFEQAVADQKSYLSRYGDLVELDREALRRVLRADLAVNVDQTSLSDLNENQFTRRLAEAMYAHQVLILGGHNLSVEGYQQLLHSLIRHASALLRQKVLANEATFNQVLLTELQGDRQQLADVQAYLNSKFNLVLSQLDDIKADTRLLPGMQTTLQQVADDVQAIRHHHGPTSRQADDTPRPWLVKAKGEHRVYLIDPNGARRWILDGPTLESMARWEDVDILASWEELQKFPPERPLASTVHGRKPWLVKVRGETEIYFIDEDKVRHCIIDQEALKSVNQSTDVDVLASWAELERFRPGKPLSELTSAQPNQQPDKPVVSSSTPSGTTYHIHIDQAKGLAIGDGAQVIQTNDEL